MSAQTSKNVIFRCARGEVTYTEPEKEKGNGQAAVKVIGAILEAAAGSNTSTTNHPEYADAVREAIAGGISESYRVRVADGWFSEEELNSDAPILYYDGSISSITTTSHIHQVKDKEGKVHDEHEYRAQVNAVINIKDAHSGEIVRTVNINSSSWSESWYLSTDKAMSYVLGKIQSCLCDNIDAAFPIYASIIEGSQVKKDKQKEVYIDLGTDIGLVKGQTFTVYQPRTVAGKEANKEIGALRVLEVLGPEVSLCKVTNGSKDIKSAIDKDETILIVSR